MVTDSSAENPELSDRQRYDLIGGQLVSGEIDEALRNALVLGDEELHDWALRDVAVVILQRTGDEEAAQAVLAMVTDQQRVESVKYRLQAARDLYRQCSAGC